MKNLGLATPQILLPNDKVNMQKWTVIACDQYNSNIEYWSDVEKIVGHNPSTLRMILPEIYLEDEEDVEVRITETAEVMESYLAAGVVEALPKGFILVQRDMPHGTRTGLVGMVDLEQYEFDSNANPKIRPTEETVLERIPPRVRIRKPALMESPHILVLLNDPEKKVIEPLVAKMNKLPLLYDFDLMKNGGPIKGYFVGDKNEVEAIYQRLAEVDEKTDILFVVGDGNHSLATAKTVWDDVKKELSEKEQKDHPKRFALVEFVNLYDEGLTFEPIHRVVFGEDSNKVINDIIKIYNKKAMDAKIFFKRSTATKLMKNTTGQTIDFVAKHKKGYIKIDNPIKEMEVINFQEVLDEYLMQNTDLSVDYIHGEDEVARLCEDENNIGFILPKLDKKMFIDVLKRHGILPKKTFSLGEADEKRFYLECRLLDVMSDKGEHAQIILDRDVIEDQLDDLDDDADQMKNNSPDNEKKKWIHQDNNEDIISMVFAKPEDFLADAHVTLDASKYLSKKDIQELKKQKRLEHLLKQEPSEIVSETVDVLDSVDDELPLTRREKRYIKKQKEYEQLLEEISVNKSSNLHQNTNDQSVAFEQDQLALKDTEQEFEYMQDQVHKEHNHGSMNIAKQATEHKQSENVLTRKERNALKHEKQLKSLMAELGIEDEDELEFEENAQPESQKIQIEVFENQQKNDSPLSRRERKQQKRQKELMERLAFLEQDGQDIENDTEKHEESNDIDAAILEEQQSNEKLQSDKHFDLANDDLALESSEKMRKKHRINPEIAEALDEDISDAFTHTERSYILEKKRLEIEKEKLALERYRIKNEAKLKRQLEKDKLKEIMRIHKEQEIISKAAYAKQELKGFVHEGDYESAIGDVIKHINEGENSESTPLVTSKGIKASEKLQIDDKRIIKLKKQKKGVLVVKRATNSYGEKQE